MPIDSKRRYAEAVRRIGAETIGWLLAQGATLGRVNLEPSGTYVTVNWRWMRFIITDSATAESVRAEFKKLRKTRWRLLKWAMGRSLTNVRWDPASM